MTNISKSILCPTSNNPAVRQCCAPHQASPQRLISLATPETPENQKKMTINSSFLRPSSNRNN